VRGRAAKEQRFEGAHRRNSLADPAPRTSGIFSTVINYISFGPYTTDLNVVESLKRSENWVACEARFEQSGLGWWMYLHERFPWFAERVWRG
jgi:hypothetical protein